MCEDAAQLFVALKCVQHTSTVDLQAQGAQPEQEQLPAAAQVLASVAQELGALQAASQQCLQQQLAMEAQVTAEQQPAAACSSTVLQALQLLWLDAPPGSAAQWQQPAWQLALPAGAMGAMLQQQRMRLLQPATVQQPDRSEQPPSQPGSAAPPRVHDVLPRLAALLQEAASSRPGAADEQQRQQQRQQPEAYVQQAYQLPGSPVVAPLAVLCGARKHQPGGVRQQPRFLQAEVTVQRKLGLPRAVSSLVAEAVQQGVPVAVFVEPAESTTVQPHKAWCTSNAPRQLLPAAELLQRGLVAAGWAVVLLVLLQKQQRADGAAAQ
jgi:hypothetical protein